MEVPKKCLGLPAPQAVMELVKCGCKGRCMGKSNCSCLKNNLSCTDFCKCEDCGNIKDYTPEGETDNDSGEEETEETSAWQIDNNLISCVDDSILRSFKYMEILTMNANNISTLGRDVFEHMKKLRVLRLADNGFKCDCHLSWLARWLRKHPRLALFTKCITPHRLRNKGVAELHDSEFKCNEPFCDYY
ncbi:Protein slit [Nymphon striatum]|nr:Protein slit [Nymphon striatum]